MKGLVNSSRRPLRSAICFVFLLAWLAGGARLACAQQPPSKFDIERARVMLGVIKDDLKKNYYDPNYHGMDVEARFKVSDDKMRAAGSIGQLWGIIAQTLLELNDSHTFFLPPQKRARTDYGWEMQMVGDHCYVGAVKPRSDAEAKGLKPGDEIESIDGRAPSRESFWVIEYLYYSLRPQLGMRLQLKRPSGEERQVDVFARVQEGKQILDLTGSDIAAVIREAESEDRLHRSRFIEFDDLLIWKMPQFDLTKSQVDDVIDKAKKHKQLLLDLRGNAGGNEEMLLRLISDVFDRDITIGELKRRKETKALIAKTRGSSAFSGKLVVIVDSGSGSAAEIFARVIQIEKRGTVIGDRTAGAVMRARDFEHQVGQDTVVFYGASITDADIIMSDGKSLERLGVMPDELRLPTPADLAAGRDPILARGADLLGVTISSEKAGSFFPLEWRK